MSIYAIEVSRGKEWIAKEKLSQLLQFFSCNLVKDVYACHTEVIAKSKKTKVAALSGYIFIRLFGDHDVIPPEVWNIIKKTPAIIRILKHAIPQEEFDLFYESFENISTTEVEVTLADNETSSDSVGDVQELQKTVNIMQEIELLNEEIKQIPFKKRSEFAVIIIFRKNKTVVHLPSYLVNEWERHLIRGKPWIRSIVNGLRRYASSFLKGGSSHG
ncbi:transcription termination/antitermination NusG family protein [Paenibacillus agricola]|uniref:NusG-like N-terminal domain-containing protein n=1 Tax=Paenibacillus agricola TaxID=2716264 RepID=A0ABX0JGH2_9BACL|nr:transcription termination/antitermination NusG family protein [Paenibacillus agricola]NHN35579.1 hypothetical protein [Paenibacillus agricola]